MKKFFKNILLFVLPLLMLCAGVEFMLRRVPNPYSFKRNILENNLHGIKHLGIGSSVMNHGFSPAHFADSSFNFAFGGQWLRYNYLLLDKYIDSLPNLENVILGICYRSLWEDEVAPVTGEPEDDMVTYYNLYLGLDENTSWKSNSEFISTKHLAFKKFIKYYISGKQTVKCDSLGLDHGKDGMKSAENKYGELTRLADKHTKYHYKSATEVYNRNIEFINKIASLCIQRGINLHIAVTPSLDDYNKLCNPEQLQLMYNALNKIYIKHNDGAPGTIASAHYITDSPASTASDIGQFTDSITSSIGQFTNSPLSGIERIGRVYIYDYLADTRFTDEDFYDGNHLRSSCGAQKFSNILREDILGADVPCADTLGADIPGANAASSCISVD